MTKWERLVPCREALVWGQGDPGQGHDKEKVEFCAMREPRLSPALSRCSSFTGCQGGETDWGTVCTPAMCDCWWVLLLSFFPVCLMYIFSYCLWDIVTHISASASIVPQQRTRHSSNREGWTLLTQPWRNDLSNTLINPA